MTLGVAKTYLFKIVRCLEPHVDSEDPFEKENDEKTVNKKTTQTWNVCSFISEGVGEEEMNGIVIFHGF